MRIPQIEERLIRWGMAVTVGDGSGYPVKSVLHPTWMPPSAGITPTMQAAPFSHDVKQTHRAIGTLSAKLKQTVCIVYCYRLSNAEQARRLGCAVDTVHARITVAHRRLAHLLID